MSTINKASIENLKHVVTVLELDEDQEEMPTMEQMKAMIRDHAYQSEENFVTASELLQAMALVAGEGDEQTNTNQNAQEVEQPQQPLLPIDNPQVNAHKVKSFLEQRNTEALKSMVQRLRITIPPRKVQNEFFVNKILDLVNQHHIPFQSIYHLHLNSNLELDAATHNFQANEEEPLRPHLQRMLDAPFTGVSFINGTLNRRNMCYIDASINTILSSYEIRKLVLMRHKEDPALAVLKTYLDQPKRINDGNLAKAHLTAYFNQIGRPNIFDNHQQHCSHEFIHYFIRYYSNTNFIFIFCKLR